MHEIMERKASSLIIITDRSELEAVSSLTAWVREEVATLSQKYDKTGIFDPRPTERGLSRRLGLRWLTWRLAKQISAFMQSEGFRPDDTLLYTPSLGPATLAALRLAKKGGCAGVITRVSAADLLRPEAERIAGQCVGKVAEMIADSDYTCRKIAELTGGENGLRVSRPIAAEWTRGVLAECHGKDEKRLTFVSAGSEAFAMTYGLLRQLAVARPGLDVKWVCFGAEPEGATPASPTNLTIQWRQGEPAEIFGSEPVDWFVSVDNSRGLQAPVIEALSRGVPVVAAMGGGIDEIIDDDNGLLLAEDSEPEEFVRGLLPYLDSEPRYRSLRTGARESLERIMEAVRPGQTI